MINEWALAIQKKIRLHDIMLLQHAFPTMGFLSKRVAEVWMMKRNGVEQVAENLPVAVPTVSEKQARHKSFCMPCFFR